MLIITTSWDDGDKLDLRLAGLLEKYNIKGTFYVPKNFGNRLSDEEIIRLSNKHEIGAHTLNHQALTDIVTELAKEEIVESKKWLETLLNKEVSMFCYPKGKYNETIQGLVREANFLGARVVEEFCFNYPNDYFTFGTSLQIYPFPLRKRDASHYHLSRVLFQPLQRKFWDIIKLGFSLKAFLSCSNLNEFLFKHAQDKGQIYHIFGHSWEIEKYNMWSDLEKVFKFISNRKDCLYLTNGETLEYIKGKK